MTIEDFYEKVVDEESYRSYGKTFLDQAKKAKNKDTVRNCLQHYCKRLTQYYGNFLAELCTGFGKTKIAADLIAELGPQHKVLVVHYQVVHKENLIKDFEKFYPGITKTHDIEFTTYRSAYKYADQYFDLIVFDECHHLTENNLPGIASIETSLRLYLSATVPDEKRQLLKKLGDYSRLRVTLKQAESWGILPTTTYLLLAVYPQHREPNLKYHYRPSTKFPPKRMSIYDFERRKHPFNTIVSCTEADYLRLLTLEMESWKSFAFQLKKDHKDDRWVWNTRILPLGSKRKAFYAKLKAQHLLPKLEELISEKRTVIFAERIDQIEGIHAIHSKQKKETNQQLIEQFNTGEINQIAAVNMLNESMNLVNIELSIIFQLATFSKVINVQRQGRAVRGFDPIILLPYIPGTKDEQVVKRYMNEFTTKIFKSATTLIQYVRDNY